MGLIVKLVRAGAKIVATVVIILVEVVCWTVVSIVQLIVMVGHVRRSWRLLHRDGEVLCPRGHAVEVTGVWRCESCGFRWEAPSQSPGPWTCVNVECQAATPWLECQVCGLSVASPYRIGSDRWGW